MAKGDLRAMREARLARKAREAVRADATRLVADLIQKQLAPLVGARILQADALIEGDEVWPVVSVRTGKGEHLVLVVKRDVEGNGPGHLDFQRPDGSPLR